MLSVFKRKKKINQLDSNGNKIGYWEHYFSFGNPLLSRIFNKQKIDCKGCYDENGNKTGCWTTYFVDGTTFSIEHFLNGKKHGIREGFWGNGKLSEKGNYENGLNVGYWEFYSIDGKVQSKGNFQNGKKIGHWAYAGKYWLDLSLMFYNDLKPKHVFHI